MPNQPLHRRWMLIVAAVVAALVVVSQPCSASVTLTFGPMQYDGVSYPGLQDGEAIGDYFAGANGGPNWGITFSSNAYNLLTSPDGGAGNFVAAPTPSYADGVANNNIGIACIVGGVVIDIPAGFDAPFTFWYMSILGTSDVTFYDKTGGADGGGAIVAHDMLQSAYLTPDDLPADGVFSQWTLESVTNFSHTARSVQFDGAALVIAFDQITVNTHDSTGPSVQDSLPGSSVPEPSTVMTWSMFGLIAGLVYGNRKRRAFRHV